MIPQHSALATSKHLMFELADEHYAVPLLDVREVLSEYELTALPHLPAVVHGVVCLRGEPIPVVNLRHRVGLPERERDRRSRVIVLDVDGMVLGLEVDSVLRVERLDIQKMVAPPRMLGAGGAPYLKGVIPDGGKFVVVVDTAGLVAGLGASLPAATGAGAGARS